MNSKTLIIVVTLVVAFIGLGAWAMGGDSSKKPNPEVDKFAQCLSEKKVVMYGAYWCSHCQNQKKLFGDSFKFINYVECTEEVKLCQEKNVKGYPTWIFEDGSRIEGEATLEQLAEKTTCQAP